MKPEVFAEWLHRQHYFVVRTSSSYWYKVGTGVYQSFPFHWVITPRENELDELLWNNHAVGLRYSTSVDAPEGACSYHVVCEEDQYNMNNFSSKMRTKVRKGLGCTRVERISFDMLAEQGWQLREETLLRQGRINAENKLWWQLLCLSAKDLPGFEAWGAFYGKRLAAAVLIFICDDTCSILYHQSLTEYLKNKVNNALTYTVTENMLSRQNISKIFYGLQSLDAPISVDEFKFEMRYTAKPVRQRVVFHPWVRPLMNPAGQALVRAGLRLKPGHPMLSKAEGMLRFYLQGKKPLGEQTKPTPVRDVIRS